jgi:predicted porin
MHNNKNYCVAAFALSAVLASPVYAEPLVFKEGNWSINPYGILDLSLQGGKFTDDHPGHTMVSDGNLQASRIGLKIDYKLGDSGYGLRAFGERGLVLRNIWRTGYNEGKISTNRGYGAGVTGPFGSVDVGSLYMPIYWVFLDSDVALYGLSNMASIMSLEHTTTLGKSGTGGFYDTTVRYRSPEVRGFSTELGYSYGNSDVQDGPNQNRTSGFNVRYRDGDTKLGYGYNHHDSAPSLTTGETYAQNTHVVTGTYRLGGVLWGANYVYSDPDSDARWFASAQMINARITFGPGDVTLGVSHRIEAEGARAWATHAGYLYSLNTDTQLYTYVSHIVNNSDSTQGFALLSESYPSVPKGYDPWAMTVGIRWGF